MAIEIESKVYVGHLPDPNAYLVTNGASITKPRIYEHNVRYESAANDFTDNQIVLRLRQDEKVRLTYKAPLPDQQAGVATRLELETSVGDYETMNAILEALGFRPYMVYEKYRTTYHFHDILATELVLDEMPYGVFIEVEGQHIEAVLARLSLAHLPRIALSYSELFEKVRHQYNLTFTDLTFGNFANLKIDPTVFKQIF